jgi:hypothetical protein
MNRESFISRLNTTLVIILLKLLVCGVASGQTYPDVSKDALAELNKQRQQRGLKPYLKDDGLTKAAFAAASYRAKNHIQGHIPGQHGDFAYLPEGSHADAAGAGALTPDWGFATCAMYDSYEFAGAAWCMGNDGRKYCHLFVRGGSSANSNESRRPRRR